MCKSVEMTDVVGFLCYRKSEKKKIELAEVDNVFLKIHEADPFVKIMNRAKSIANFINLIGRTDALKDNNINIAFDSEIDVRLQREYFRLDEDVRCVLNRAAEDIFHV